MNTPFTDQYDQNYLLEAMMGPNAMRIIEELASYLPLSKGMRVLDLGCGMGISSILLAQKFGVTVPGFTGDYTEGNLPPEVKPFWTPEWYFYSLPWWRALWEKEAGIEIVECREMDCCQQAWDEWLKSPSQHAEGDIPMMEAGCGKYFNFIQLVGRKK